MKELMNLASKIEIVSDIRKLYGNTLSQNQVQKYLGMGTDQIREFLVDVPYLRKTRKKRFLAIDIARKIYEQQETAS